METSVPKIVVLGMGFLATYVSPCYERLLGKDWKAHIAGVKGSPRGLDEKRRECGFPVSVRDGAEVLRRMEPEIVVLSVKPHQIAEMTTGTLAPYFDGLRRAGKPLPDIYSFAPDPTVDFFLDALGGDVNAVNMIPNMVREIDGVDVSQVGISFVSFDPRRTWPEAARARALRFLEPTGTVVEIGADKAIPYLACQCACHVMFEMNYIAQDVLAEFGRTATLGQTASAFRAVFREFFNEPCAQALPCETGGVDEKALPLFRQMLDGWRRGVLAFAVSEGIADQAASRNILGSMESYSMQAQTASKAALIRSTRNHATPGGFLEMCLTTLHKEGYARMTEGLRACMRGEATPDFDAEIGRIAFQVAKAISDHGKTTRNARADRSRLEDIPLYRLP